jgi:hypothetical protein
MGPQRRAAAATGPTCGGHLATRGRGSSRAGRPAWCLPVPVPVLRSDAMNRTSRALATVTLLVALAVPLACGDDDDGDVASTGTTIPSPTTSTTGAGATTTAGAPATTVRPTTTTATTTTAATGNVIEVTVADGKVTGGGRKQVDKGEPLTLRVTSDEADEVHVHGYDLKVDLEVGQPGEITFTPDVAGVYEVELEDAGLQLLELEVK